MKVNVDFKVLSPLDTTILMVVDNSEWGVAEDKQSTIYITTPGASTPITNIFAKHKINTYNSTNLGLTCINTCEDIAVDLPDGIYTIRLTSAYTDLEKTRYYLKTDRFQVDFYREWLNTGLDYTNTKDVRYDALLDCRKHLISAEACTVEGDFSRASREFGVAQQKLDKIKKCKNCY